MIKMPASTLFRDDKHDLEQALTEAGYDTGEIDGVADGRTEAAIKSFSPIIRDRLQ